MTIPVGLVILIGGALVVVLASMGAVIYFQREVCGHLREEVRLLTEIKHHNENIHDLQEGQIDNYEDIVQGLVDFLDVLYAELEWTDADYLKRKAWEMARLHTRHKERSTERDTGLDI